MIRRILLILFLLFGMLSFACEEVDGVYYLSKELKEENNILLNELKSIELLARQKEWAGAALKVMDLKSSASITNILVKGDVPLAMALDVLNIAYLFNANCEDTKVIEEINDALNKYSIMSKTKKNFFYAELYRLKMAYFWRQGNRLKHDEALKELALYDVNDQEALLVLMTAYRERPDNFENISLFPNAYISNGGVSNALWRTAEIFLSSKSEDKKWEESLKWLKSSNSLKNEELCNHLDFMATMLSVAKPERSYDYCNALVNFIGKNSEKEFDISLVSIALSEYYRVLSLITSAPGR